MLFGVLTLILRYTMYDIFILMSVPNMVHFATLITGMFLWYMICKLLTIPPALTCLVLSMVIHG